MALSESDKRRIVEMIDRMDNQSQRAILSSMDAFRSWLRHTASWLWERIKEFFTTKTLENIWGIIFG